MEIETPASVSGHDIVVKQWSEEEFANAQSEWASLLAHSDANPLFMSWEWHFNWWESYSDDLCKLSICAAYEGHQLVGIAPLYVERDFYLKGVIPVKRLQFIGKRLGGSGGIRTEYLSLIASKHIEKLVIERLIEFVVQLRTWNELSFADCQAQTPCHSLTVSSLEKYKFYSRQEGEGSSYLIDSTASFKAYLESLGKNTRLKLYNRRTLLEKLGDAELIPLSNENSDFFVKELNHYLSDRWQRVILSDRNWGFITALCSSSSGKISYLDSSILCLNREPISVMLNIRVASTVYTILLGYKQNFDKKFSLGLLHCGYLFEMCFNDSQVEFIDMLEGDGKNNNYKTRIAGITVNVKSIRWFRSPLLKVMFKFYDRFLRK
ncbi:GNAT family N-acetyltransferase [Reinekea marinisedimentorum]|uniref:Acetyltransferase (GNAT) family protein n=1 Tax=Reinekea marinisedimentorum TaxID=230495 RepID=A0A4R3ID29_9GAMM|nr:GNAT family N-acetyltransferase [Reinekea marinisedimentorum]TCS44105.1 acetyltransferase (GNAT) family protein [Reinekea marinisedimentorum]